MIKLNLPLGIEDTGRDREINGKKYSRFMLNFSYHRARRVLTLLINAYAIRSYV